MSPVALEKGEISWLREPEAHDYPAAFSYLSLLFGLRDAQMLVSHLRTAPVVQFKAKDLFRASGLSVLGVSNSHVTHDLNKIHADHPLSPLLAVRGVLEHRLIIADGYHRLCAVYIRDEDALIPVKIV